MSQAQIFYQPHLAKYDLAAALDVKSDDAANCLRGYLIRFTGEYCTSLKRSCEGDLQLSRDSLLERLSSSLSTLSELKRSASDLDWRSEDTLCGSVFRLPSR